MLTVLKEQTENSASQLDTRAVATTLNQLEIFKPILEQV